MDHTGSNAGGGAESGASSGPSVDVKLALSLGEEFSVEVVRNRLADGTPDTIALLASKYVPFPVALPASYCYSVVHPCSNCPLGA